MQEQRNQRARGDYKEDDRENRPRGDYREGDRDRRPRGDYREGDRNRRPRGDYREGDRDRRPREDYREGNRDDRPRGDYREGDRDSRTRKTNNYKKSKNTENSQRIVYNHPSKDNLVICSNTKKLNVQVTTFLGTLEEKTDVVVVEKIDVAIDEMVETIVSSEDEFIPVQAERYFTKWTESRTCKICLNIIQNRLPCNCIKQCDFCLSVDHLRDKCNDFKCSNCNQRHPVQRCKAKFDVPNCRFCLRPHREKGGCRLLISKPTKRSKVSKDEISSYRCITCGKNGHIQCAFEDQTVHDELLKELEIDFNDLKIEEVNEMRKRKRDKPERVAQDTYDGEELDDECEYRRKDEDEKKDPINIPKEDFDKTAVNQQSHQNKKRTENYEKSDNPEVRTDVPNSRFFKPDRSIREQDTHYDNRHTNNWEHKQKFNGNVNRDFRSNYQKNQSSTTNGKPSQQKGRESNRGFDYDQYPPASSHQKKKFESEFQPKQNGKGKRGKAHRVDILTYEEKLSEKQHKAHNKKNPVNQKLPDYHHYEEIIIDEEVYVPSKAVKDRNQFTDNSLEQVQALFNTLTLCKQKNSMSKVIDMGNVKKKKSKKPKDIEIREQKIRDQVTQGHLDDSFAEATEKIRKKMNKEKAGETIDEVNLEYSPEDDEEEKQMYYQKELIKPSFKSLSRLIFVKDQYLKKIDPVKFYEINKHPDGSVKCTYSNRNLGESVDQCQNMNKDHLAPKKLFEGKHQGHFNRNLHNLFPADEVANHTRAHKLLFDASILPEEEKSKLELVENDFGIFWNADPGFFIPKQNMGVFARAWLYSILKYHKIIKALPKRVVDFLIDQSLRHPVTDWERRHNALVQKLQFDRNPFIDHPSLVSLIEFPFE